VNENVSPVITPDGPTGPLHRFKRWPDAGADLGQAAVAHGLCGIERLAFRVMDDFVLPRPGSRIAIAIGAPVKVDRSVALSQGEVLEQWQQRLEWELASLSQAGPGGAGMNPWRQVLVDRAPWVIIGIALLVFGAGLGLRDPWPADEPVYALIARDMLRHGNWLIPMVGGDYFQDKPPLLFWLQAVFYWITGSHRIGFLLPSLLAGIGIAAAGLRPGSPTRGVARRVSTRRWCCCSQCSSRCRRRRAQLDALLVFFTTLSLLLPAAPAAAGRWLAVAIGAGIAAGLGTLSKVVGFFSFMVLLPWLFAGVARLAGSGMAEAPGRHGRSQIAWAAVRRRLVPVWLLAQRDAGVSAYFHELVFVQTFGRYVDPWHHYRPAWYYLQVMATLWLPAVLLLPWLVPRWAAALRRRDARVLLPLGFAAVYLLFFTASSGKRDLYILSALPMLALPMGYLLPELWRKAAVQRLLAGFTTLVSLACVGLWIYLVHVDAARGARLLEAGGIGNSRCW
jgi:4-amino-4-deoxy-L-arabinose transferase-like glycosyltransferase